MTGLLALVIVVLVGYIWTQRNKSNEITIRITSDANPNSPADVAQDIDKDAWDPTPDDLYPASGDRKTLKGVRLHVRCQDPQKTGTHPRVRGRCMGRSDRNCAERQDPLRARNQVLALRL